MADISICPEPKEVQDFLFKQASIGQICNEFQSIPANPSLVAVDSKRGLLFVGHMNKIVVVKPGADSNPEWKLDFDLPAEASRVALSCDCSLLAVTFDQPFALIYSVDSIHKHKLYILHEIRLSTMPGQISVLDLKWNPTIPEMLCSITSDHTIGCFQVGKEKKLGVQIVGMERPQGLEALCVSWSPKGKQLVVGCKNSDIVQLKPELKVARHISGSSLNQGMIISLLWISNYQFCACYFQASEERVSVMIADAPKGANVPKLTNYEDVTYGSGSLQGLYYYFEHIAEWGVIVAASSHSSELAVLGTFDNAISWNLYQLMDNCSVQLPVDRKKGTENYPLGVVIDRTSSSRLPWGPESTLPNPVPIIRILVTSGQLCSYHIVNLKENAPAICAPAPEMVPPPAAAQARPSLCPSEVSFNLPNDATSTPRSKGTAPQPQQAEKLKPSSNLFGSAAAPNFSFLPQSNKVVMEPVAAQFQATNTSFPGSLETMTSAGLFAQPAAKGNVNQLENKPKNSSSLPASTKLSADSDRSQAGDTEAVAPAMEPRPPQPSVKSPVKKSSLEYDEALCARAYVEEQSLFEHELRERLIGVAAMATNWSCGLEQERTGLLKRTQEIDDFVRELQETTAGLAGDVAYLKGLLLQSFAWLEESRLRNSFGWQARGGVGRDGPGGTSSNGGCSKLTKLRSLYEHTQTQMMQATRVLDLEWAEFKGRETSRMKLPNLEVIYLSLIRHNQIVGKQRKNLAELTRRWRNILRGGRGGGVCNGNGLVSLDKSMSGLSICQQPRESEGQAVELRCKLIAASVRNFGREKQAKLRDLLSESAPKIVKAQRPSALQDRLEATLSSLASARSAAEVASSGIKAKAKLAKQPQLQQQQVQQSPLSLLDNMVASMGKSPPGSPALAAKVSASAQSSSRSKENLPASFAKINNDAAMSKLAAFAQQQQQTSTSLPRSSAFNFSAPALASSAPRLDNAAFKFSTIRLSDSLPQQQQAAAKLGLSSLNLGGKTAAPAPASLSTFSFGKPGVASPPPQQQQQLAPTLGASLFGKSAAATATTRPEKATTTSTALVFGGLGSSGESAATFSFAPAIAVVTTTITAAVSSTSAAVFVGEIPKAAIATTAVGTVEPALAAVSSTTPCFGSLLGATTSLNFGAAQPSAAAAASSAFDDASKAPATAANIFGSSTAASAAATATSSAPASASTFGKPSGVTPTSSLSPFNSAISLPSTAPGSGAATTTAAPTSVFGSATSSGSIFGGQAAVPATSAAGSSLFGAKNPVVATAAAIVPSLFMGTGDAVVTTTAAAATGSIFGGSGAAAMTATGGASDSIFGGAVFAGTGGAAAATQSNNVFASVSSSTPRSGTSIFGGAAVSNTSSASGTSVFGSSGASVFGSTPTNSAGGSILGGASKLGNPAANTSVFGAASPTSSIFGGAASGAATGSAPAATGSIFGGAAAAPAASVFGAASATPATSGASVFGGPPVMGGAGGVTSLFGGGGGGGGGSVFGQAATFGTKPVFGGGFGSPPSFGAAASPGFGSPTAFGGAPMGGSSASPGSSVFGSSTFETLGAQSGGLSFGSLAQTTPEPAKPQSFQGSTSFSSWR